MNVLAPEFEQHARDFLGPREHQAAVQLLLRTFQSPGPSLRELVEHAPTGRDCTASILDHLVQDHVLVCADLLGARRFFPANVHDEEAQRHLAVLRNPDARRLYAFMQGATWCQRDLINAAEAWGWSRTKTRRCLERLRRVHLVWRRGGTTRYPSWQTLPVHALAAQNLPTDEAWIVGIGPTDTL